MFKSFILLAVGVMLCLPVFASAESRQGQIELKLSGLRKAQGLILINVFQTSAGFPGDADKAVLYHIHSVTNTTETIVLPSLPYGDYAFSILHDENSDLRMQKNALGIPREGIAFSNNAFHAMRAPTFKEARFSLQSSLLRLSVRVHYYR